MKLWASRAGQDANRVKRDAAVGGYVRLKTNPNVIRGPDSVLRRLSVIHVNAHDKASKDSRELCDLLLSQVSQQVTETGRHEAIKCCSVGVTTRFAYAYHRRNGLRVYLYGKESDGPHSERSCEGWARGLAASCNEEPMGTVVAVLFGIGQRAGSACSHPTASLFGSPDRPQEGVRTIPVAVRGQRPRDYRGLADECAGEPDRAQSSGKEKVHQAVRHSLFGMWV